MRDLSSSDEHRGMTASRRSRAGAAATTSTGRKPKRLAAWSGTMIARITDRPRRAALAVASLAISAGLAGAAFFPGPQGGSALAAAIRDPMAMFAARSPGQRPEGALARTKKRLASTSTAPPPGAASPTERVLSTGRTRPAPIAGDDPVLAGSGPAVVLGNGPPIVGDAGPVIGGGALGPALPAFGSAVPIGIGSPGGGGVGGVGGGGGGGPTTGTPNPGAPAPLPEVTTPVPEPTSWLSMIVGMAMIGLALRRRGVRPSREQATPLIGRAGSRDAG